MKKKSFLLMPFFTFLIIGCGSDNLSNPNDNVSVALTGISSSTDSYIALYSGEEEQISIVYEPPNATNKTLTWVSDNNTIATVDDTGTITAMAEGTAIITAIALDGGHTAMLEVRVFPENADIPLRSITLTPDSTSILIGSTETIEVTYSPNNATNKTLTWVSDDDSITTVDNTGTITAVAQGTAVITAISNADSTITGEVNVTVVDNSVDPNTDLTVYDDFTYLKVDANEWNAWTRFDLISNELKPYIQNATKAAYQQLRDEFDMISFVLDTDTIPAGRPYGQFSFVSNSIEGLGINIFDNSSDYGSSGALQGIFILYRENLLRLGPFLHEMGHRWFNHGTSLEGGSHWPAGIPQGAPGYTVNGTGIFQGPWETFAPIELYMMGLIPGSDPSIQNDATNKALYDDIIATNGERAPAYPNAQTYFRVLVMVISPNDYTAQFDWIRDVEWVETTNTQTQGVNWHRQTGGLGSLTLSGLNALIK